MPTSTPAYWGTGSESSVRALPVIMFLFLGLVVLITGCDLAPSGDIDSTARFRDLVTENQALWDSTGIEDYQIIYDRFVGQEESRNVFVRVRGGVVDSVSQSGGPVQDGVKILKVEDIFVEMLEVLDRDDRGSFSVAFDRELSYPVRYQVQAGDSTPQQAVFLSSFQDDTPEE